MQSLELKIPPPVVALVTAIAMRLIAYFSTTYEMSTNFRFALALAIALIGGAFSLAGVISLRLAKATVNSRQPGKASPLVTTGIYRLTRNPMYLGLLLVLIGWAVYCSTPFAFLGAIAFVIYINQFQIKPEERALSSMFRKNYTEYMSRVRRWI